MDLGVVLTLGVLYAVLSFIGKIAKSGKPSDPTAPPRARVPGRPETLEDLLAEMRGQVERAKQTQAEPEAVSRELPGRVVGRELRSFDDGAEAVAASRIREAASRDHALNAADHAAFDRKIRRVAPVVVVDTRRRDALRKAVVWSEILGTPKGLREE
ncbi:MAG: hypothetical protein ABI542_03260 [Gemmatimonadota bacterium]